MKRTLLGAVLLGAVLLGGAGPAGAEQLEIRLWHALAGTQGVELEQLASRFNATQGAYRVVPAYKGSYAQTLAASLDARGWLAPHLVQVDEAGGEELLSRKGAVRPFWQVMAQAHLPLDVKYVSAVAGPFSDARGRLLALPLNTSTPVLYFNRDAFRRARLDPVAPKSWYDMAHTLGALIDAGQACGYTTSWPAWVLLENMSAWHDQPFATLESGAAGDEARFAFNGQLMVRWVAMLASWQKSGYFTYAGRENEAEARFAAGECAVLTAPSSSYAALRERSRFEVAVAPLPYYDDFSAAPQNTLARGAGLWVMQGRPDRDYAGVARFLAYLATPQVQAEWHQRTGYAPLTQAAYELTRAQGFYASHPGHEVAMRQLLVKAPTRDSRGMRLGGLPPRIRDVLNEELESVWGGRKTPLEALNAAVARGNAMLRLKHDGQIAR
jgi:sn-glycerol 3-phosphate transport system substrate-binding protein